MEKVMTLDDKVRAYKELLDKKDALAEQTKANNEELKNMEQEIARQMVDEEKPDTTVDGKRSGILRCFERAGVRTPYHRTG